MAVPNYSLPAYLDRPADPAEHYLKAYQVGVQISLEQQRNAREAASQQLDNQLKLQLANQQNEREMHQMAIDKALREQEIGLRRSAEDRAAKAAADIYSRRQKFQAMMAVPGSDPIKSAMASGLVGDMSAGEAAMMRLAEPKPAAPAPQEITLPSGARGVWEGRSFKYEPKGPAQGVLTAEQKFALGQAKQKIQNFEKSLSILTPDKKAAALKMLPADVQASYDVIRQLAPDSPEARIAATAPTQPTPAAANPAGIKGPTIKVGSVKPAVAQSASPVPGYYVPAPAPAAPPEQPPARPQAQAPPVAAPPPPLEPQPANFRQLPVDDRAQAKSDTQKRTQASLSKASTDQLLALSKRFLKEDWTFSEGRFEQAKGYRVDKMTRKEMEASLAEELTAQGYAL